MIPVLGVALGSGLIVIRRSLRPDVPTHRLERYGVTSAGRVSMMTRCVAEIERRAHVEPADIAITGTHSAAVATERLIYAGAGCLIPVSMWMVTSAAGASLSAWMMFVAAIGLVAVGFQYPALRLHRLAASTRREFRTSLSAYLDLVSIMLSGGAGIETALHAAVRVGDGPTFARIAEALDVARTSRRSPWETLSDTGTRIGVEELPELAATVRLGGEQGARMTASLVAKASAMRSRQLADIEASANAATERMGVPMVLLFLGFLVLLGYPAMQMITSGFEG